MKDDNEWIKVSKEKKKKPTGRPSHKWFKVPPETIAYFEKMEKLNRI